MTKLAKQQANLEKMTVKRLWEIVQTMDLPPGYKMSHLCLKADLKHFLVDADDQIALAPVDDNNGLYCYILIQLNVNFNFEFYFHLLLLSKKLWGPFAFASPVGQN